MIEIKNSVYYVGVNDRNKALFEAYGHYLMAYRITLI